VLEISRHIAASDPFFAQTRRYPRILGTMLVYKRAHAFQVNKTALTNVPGMDFGLILDAFGVQLNLRSTVEYLISDW
jgi:hypothetical protein